jgi:thymidylate synthase (FAD)
MQVIKPYFEIEDVDGEEMLKEIERAGRTCYKSEERITETSARKFVESIIKSGHESVIEHEKVTVRVICDRGVTHEIVRHRIASYSQESTRYCNYGGKGIRVIEPLFFDHNAPTMLLRMPQHPLRLPDSSLCFQFNTEVEMNEFDVWYITMLFLEWAYTVLVNDFKRSPQEARSVLPNSLKTEIVITYNLREWRHFFKLRTSKRAHPQMREITIPMLAKFKASIPVIFDDIEPEKL